MQVNALAAPAHALGPPNHWSHVVALGGRHTGRGGQAPSNQMCRGFEGMVVADQPGNDEWLRDLPD
jgi:hypothetical protein